MPQHFNTPEQFIAYCENRAESAQALFTLEEITLMLSLTGKTPQETVLFNMRHLCLLARFNIAKKAKKAGQKFDDSKFRHLTLVS